MPKPFREDSRMILRPTLRLIIFAIATLAYCAPTLGFQMSGEQILVTRNVRDIELVVGASQPLKFDYAIPKLMVQVPEVVDASAISANEILLTGLKPGISMVTVVDSEGNSQTLTVAVKIDVRILQRAIDKIFPTSQVSVDALSSKVILSGYVADPEQIASIMELAQDYFPLGVIGNMRIAKSPNVAIQVKIYEVNRTKIRRLGVDWSYFGPDFQAVSSFADIIQSFSDGVATTSGETFSASVIGDNSRFNAFVDALEQHNVAKLLDEPTLVSKDGRPAEFLSGGEVPFQVASGLGNNSIQFRPFGTKLDIVPIILGRGRLTLEVRAEVSEVDNSISTTDGVPGFRVRRVNTAVDMTVGHTLALAGDFREDVEVIKRGTPKLMHQPFWGAAFRKTEEVSSETELVFLMTPRFIDSVEAASLNPVPFGKSSKSPSNRELYRNAYNEVPTCPGDGCPTADAFRDRAPVQGAYPGVPQPHFQQTPNTPTVVAPPVSSKQQAPTRSRQASGFSWPGR